MPKTPKRQLNVRISAEAHAALEVLARDTTQAEVIERTLIQEMQMESETGYTIEVRYRKRLPSEVEATKAIRQQALQLAGMSEDITTVQAVVSHDMQSLLWDAFAIWRIALDDFHAAESLFSNIADGNAGTGFMYLESKQLAKRI